MSTKRQKYPGRVLWYDDSPSGSEIDSFYQSLRRLNYSNNRIRILVRAAQHFAYLAYRKKISISALDDQFRETFAHHLKHCRCLRYSSEQTMSQLAGARRFLQHLRDFGIAAAPTLVAAPEEPALLIAFCQWMRQQRGTGDSTIRDYITDLRELLRCLGEDPRCFDARGLREFVMQRSRDRGQRLIQRCITALRLFLRFLVAEGHCAAGLEAAVPTLAHWRLSSLPRFLQPEEIERILASCDIGKPIGKRDRAILLLLARLGLRAGDIVQLRLKDIDWQNACVRVCGKGRRETRLPLTKEVGDAIVEYLRNGRQQTSADTVFVRSAAPFNPFSSHCPVSTLVASAIRRAGVTRPCRGAAHLLRHSLATSLLREGASLQDIATVLRHRSIQTTQIYAKVDIEALRQIAQPWPEGTSC